MYRQAAPNFAYSFVKFEEKNPAYSFIPAYLFILAYPFILELRHVHSNKKPLKGFNQSLENFKLQSCDFTTSQQSIPSISDH